MSFSLSTFTLEVDGKPTLVFAAKWQVEADQICQSWVQSNWDHIPKQRLHGIELPPALKVRLAHSSEKATYEAEAGRAELCGNVHVVKLADVAEHQD
jgi:hypothetical protein